MHMLAGSIAQWPLRTVTADDSGIEAIRESDFLAPFDLSTGPLIRATLVSVRPQNGGGQRSLLILTAHHIVCDGWSFGVVVEEFCSLYEGVRLPAPAAYTGYAISEASRRGDPEHAGQLDWWKQKFAAVPDPCLLPADRPRPAQPQYGADMIQVDFPAELTEKLHRFCAERRVTPYHVALTAFRILVFRLSGQSDLIIGTPAAAQISRGLPDLIGHCVQFLPLRFSQHSGETADSLLQNTRNEVLEASENDGVTYGEILENLPHLPAAQRRTLVPLSFSFEAMPRPLAFGGLTGSVEMNIKHRLSFEAGFYVQHSEQAIRLVCAWQTALFDNSTIRSWLGHYQTVLSAMLDDPPGTDRTVAAAHGCGAQ